jgi:hypothetical protein
MSLPINILFFALRPNAGHGLLILETAGSHSLDAPVVRTPLDE